MTRLRRTTNKNNIIILCEGSDTEVKYFKDIKKYVESNYPDRFSDIRIVPVKDEIIQPKNNKRSRKQILPAQGQTSTKHYWAKWEHSDEEYEKYKTQPVRYVRETQLFMEEDGYLEGWAVFDKDTFTGHDTAFALAESIKGLQIAFSSYCFEEWILLHFERNIHPFTASVCKDISGKDCGCGTNVSPDCHGTVCLAGYIRENNYIPDYTKDQDSIFAKYTLPNMELCLLNAAWSRALSSDLIYSRNPYTDVDNLVKRLLDNHDTYNWYYLNDSIAFCGSTICLFIENYELVIENRGERAIILTSKNCSIRDVDTTLSRKLDLGLLNPAERNHISMEKHDAFLCLRDGYTINYISLTYERSVLGPL